MLSQVAPAVPLVVEYHSRCHEDLMNATIEAPAAAIVDELPIRVREAAVFLGVSPQTVYLWVERKQIPHLRVMGRNIRFLKSELEPFVIPPIRWPLWPGDASKPVWPSDGSWPTDAS